jgi:hypothetical protein
VSDKEFLGAVPVLPDAPLRVLWQSTVVDIEPGTRYGYQHDAASINTTLAIANDSDVELSFPMILATTDPEERDDTHFSVRVGSEQPELKTLEDTEFDAEWTTLASAMAQQAQAQGYDRARIQRYIDELKADVKRARKSPEVKIPPRGRRFIRSYQRRLLSDQGGNLFRFIGIFPLPQFVLVPGGTISVTVLLPRSTQDFGVDLIDWTRNFAPQAFGKDPGLPQIAGRYGVSWFWRNDPELFVTYTYAGAV